MHFVILILNPDILNFDCFRYRVNAWFLYGWFWIHTRKVCWNEILPRSSVLITFSTSISFIWIDKWPIMKTNLVYRSKISVVNSLLSWLKTILIHICRCVYSQVTLTIPGYSYSASPHISIDSSSDAKMKLWGKWSLFVLK